MQRSCVLSQLHLPGLGGIQLVQTEKNSSGMDAKGESLCNIKRIKASTHSKAQSEDFEKDINTLYHHQLCHA